MSRKNMTAEHSVAHMARGLLHAVVGNASGKDMLAALDDPEKLVEKVYALANEFYVQGVNRHLIVELNSDDEEWEIDGVRLKVVSSSGVVAGFGPAEEEA